MKIHIPLLMMKTNKLVEKIQKKLQKLQEDLEIKILEMK